MDQISSKQQAANAVKLYDSKSWEYDSTWHSDFTKRFSSYLQLQPGQAVLDLACGTGLLTFLESEMVGPLGSVVGIDVTPSMLTLAARKKAVAGEKYDNVEFHQGNILHLDEIETLKGRTFDVVTVASALVLFPDPKVAVEHWSEYLKPGGALVVDATHPRNLVAGIVLERVAQRLHLPIPYNRTWSRSELSLKKLLESAGLEVDTVTTIENQTGYGRRYHDLDAWDDLFVENVIVKDVTRTFANHEVRREAQRIYKEEWEKLVVGGKVEEVDAVFLGIARKPADGSRYTATVIEQGEVFKGGCRCGGIQYTASTAPSDITLCYCRACQQVSGSGYLAFIHLSKAALTYTKSATLATLKLSDAAERAFCSNCGAPIAMAYSFDEESISVTVSSTDWASFGCEPPRVKEHIYLAEKAAWVKMPDDRAEKWGTMASAHLLG